MHLPGEPDPSDVRADPCRHPRDDVAARRPPVFRSLLRPSRVRRVQRIFFGRVCEQLTTFIDRDAANAGGPDVEAE